MSSAFTRNCVDLGSLKKAVKTYNADKDLLVVCVNTRHAVYNALQCDVLY